MPKPYKDWGEASEKYDEIRYNLLERDLAEANEAQTRFDLIDRLIREVLGWQHGQINVEEHNSGERAGYVDYILRAGDSTIVIEAKRIGAAFPSPTRKTQLKLSGSLLGSGEIGKAIAQAESYARDKEADVVVVTNGMCWCFFATEGRNEDSYATLLFPIDNPQHAEELFDYCAETRVEVGSLRQITNQVPQAEDRLVSAFKYADDRIDRNNIADHIMPALERALYADALLTDPEQLKRCFVTTEARAKFDTTLGMHLADPRPATIQTARRVRTGQEHGPLEQLVEMGVPKYAPPVTLIMGPVGAGKSTYLKHFELVSGRSTLEKSEAHWIYIDFEAMGKAGAPRAYLYEKLLAYIEAERPKNTIDSKNTIAPAYEAETRAWARGPLALIFTNKGEFNKKVSERITADYEKIEPYVDRVLTYLASKHLCVIVLDNIDLYEDDALETSVFSEGLALSRRIQCHVLVSIRDRTFVRHRTDSAFDAYELNKLWIDPPPLKSVISSRLSYSRNILKGRSAKIPLPNGMVLNVPDLSVFFEIVQRSILSAEAGEFIDGVAEGNIRRGITLVRNFLTSGHIQADRALKRYIVDDDRHYIFPFHEIYKGSMLGQWLHFREDRAESVNLFDARLGSKRLRLVRHILLNELAFKAQHENTLEVLVSACSDLLGPLGVSESQVVGVLQFLYKAGLVRNVNAEDIGAESTVVLTRTGGYYTKILSRKMVYVEECMFDTAIEDPAVWKTLSDLTTVAQDEQYPGARMEVRRDRLRVFLDYLVGLEKHALELLPGSAHLGSMDAIRTAVLKRTEDAVARAKRKDADYDDHL